MNFPLEANEKQWPADPGLSQLWLSQLECMWLCVLYTCEYKHTWLWVPVCWRGYTEWGKSFVCVSEMVTESAHKPKCSNLWEGVGERPKGKFWEWEYVSIRAFISVYVCWGKLRGNFVFGCVLTGHCPVGVLLSPSGNSQCMVVVHAFRCAEG